jgi:hypothetical protein
MLEKIILCSFILQQAKKKTSSYGKIENRINTKKRGACSTKIFIVSNNKSSFLS